MNLIDFFMAGIRR